MNRLRNPIARTALFGMILIGAGSAGFIGCFKDAPHAAPKSTGTVSVYAGAGMTDVLSEIGEVYERTQGVSVRFNFAASSTLARQIEAGAPAQVFISANARWMDYLERAGLIRTGTRRDLLANRLVLIAPKGAAFSVETTPDFDFAGAFAGRLALGDPDHVPAGIYARESLDHLGWYESLRSRFLPGSSVRAALAAVELKEAGAGIVYATDAKASSKVELLAVLPSDSHDPIRFPAAVCRDASDAAAAFHEYLYGPEAAAVFRRHGFTPLALASTKGPDDATRP